MVREVIELQFPINNSTILRLKPRLKQYMEIDIKKLNFRWYDDQLRLYSNTDSSFFYYRYYGNYCDSSWWSGSYQVSNRRFGSNTEKVIGLGIDYDNCILSWYLNGSLKYSMSLYNWSDGVKANKYFYQYTNFEISSEYPLPNIYINDEEMKYPIPSGYVSVYEGSYPFYKIYDNGQKYSYINSSN